MNIRFETTSSGPSCQLEISGRASHLPFTMQPELRGAFLADGCAEDNLDQLFQPGAVCVTTGQQPGLLTGPLYTVYKALTAVALAGTLERRLGRRVVPVFWVAGDDHDFAETNHLFMPSEPDGVDRIAIRERDEAADLTPMYREQVGGDIDAVVQRVLALTRETEFRPLVVDWIRAHYRPEADLSSAFAGALSALMGRFGMVVLQPTHVEFKRAMSSSLIEALRKAPELDERLRDRSDQLKQEGIPVPVSIGDNATTVMIESSLGRDRLLMAGASFLTRRAREEWSLAELESVAENEPQRLSPNVLLRPVVEAAILPTLAYVAGPGELAYRPLAAPVYELLGVVPQAFVPRWGGRVIENRTEKTLEKFGIGADDLMSADGQLEARLVRDQMPELATGALERLRAVTESEYRILADAVADLDPSLRKPVGAAQHRTLRELNAVEKKIIHYLKQLNETAVRQLGNARISLFPNGKPQERIHNIVTYMVRYGDAFLDAVYEQCRSWVDPLETDSDRA